MGQGLRLFILGIFLVLLGASFGSQSGCSSKPKETKIKTYRYEVLLFDKIVHCNRIYHQNCGLELMDTDDGIIYDCLVSVQYRDNGCGCF